MLFVKSHSFYATKESGVEGINSQDERKMVSPSSTQLSWPAIPLEIVFNVNPHTSLEISHGPRLLICFGNLPRSIVIESRMTQRDTTGTVCNLLIVINSFYTSVNKVGIVPFKRVTRQSYKCIELGLRSTINLFIIDHSSSISARTSV